jgi:hypothetical protein
MSVTEDQMEISGMHLEEPVTVQRMTARGQIKLQLLDMKIRADDGRRYRMKYPKNDPQKCLVLARLEAWLDPDFPNDPDVAQQRVDKCLKKWACRMVTHYISFLLALQIIGLTFIVIGLVVTLQQGEENVSPFEETALMIVGLGLVTLMVGANATFLILIRLGQMWILYFVILFYSLICPIGLVSLSPIAIAIGGLVIYYSIKAMSDYKRLSPEIGGIIM